MAITDVGHRGRNDKYESDVATLSKFSPQTTTACILHEQIMNVSVAKNELIMSNLCLKL